MRREHSLNGVALPFAEVAAAIFDQHADERSILGDVSLNSDAVGRSGKLNAKAKQHRHSSQKASSKDTTSFQEVTGTEVDRVVKPKLQDTTTQRKRKCRVKNKQKKKRKKNRADPQAITLASDHFLNSFLPENCFVQSGFNVQESYDLAPIRYDANKLTLDCSPFDTRAICMVNYAPDYASDIFQWFYHREVKFYIPSYSPCADNFDIQTEMCPSPYIVKGTLLNAAKRSVLVDWMIAASAKLRANNDTIHVAVNILDRFLAANDILHNSILQLVGVTALSIAFKFEEMHSLDLKDCVHLTKRACTKQQILDMEGDILSTLGFSINAPTSYKFLKRFVFLTRASKTMKLAAMFYLEKTLLKHQALAYRSSLLAAAACCLAINHPELVPKGSLHGVDNDSPGIPQVLIDYSCFDIGEIRRAAEFVARAVSEPTIVAPSRRLKSAEKKYRATCYRAVSELPPPDVVDLMD